MRIASCNPAEIRGAPALPELEFIHESPFANLYLYPREVDYLRSRPLTGWTNLEANVRGTDAAWTLPELDADGPLLSLGSLGAADTALMQSLIDSLSGAPVRVIVSMGPQHDELQLAGNMTGAEFLPQTSILPLVDVVITHGGNNTVTESLYFGNARLAAVSLRLQATPGTSVAAAALERATT